MPSVHLSESSYKPSTVWPSHVLEAAIRNLCRSFRVEETNEFLCKLMPLSEDQINIIYDDLVEKGLYDAKVKRWKNISRSSTCSGEDDMYLPFVEIANAINDCAEFKVWTEVKGRWHNIHSRRPKSKGITAPSIRPNSVFASKNSNIITLQKKIDELKATQKEKEQEMSRNDPAEKMELSQVWWLQVSTVMKMKAKATENDSAEALLQLCCYMQQMFGEQLDRRFAFGLTLCSDQLSVFLCDRSGMLGMREAINIHMSPRELIQVIASFSILKPHQLGWDPSMKIYYPENTPHLSLPSYEFPFEMKKIGLSLYELNWVINSVAADLRTREDFLTVRAISIADSEVMCGRASIVWEVVKLLDRQKCDKKVYVLKQGWQRFEELQSISGEPFEATVHRTAGLYEGRIYSSEYVLSNDDVPDTTLEHIRKGLSGNNKEQPLFVPTSNPYSINSPVQSDIESRYHERIVHPNEQLEYESPQLVSRVFTRIIMETWGWPIKYFKDNLELLTVIRDAVQDHKDFYLSGVLHRDVSVGNILICPREGNRSETWKFLSTSEIPPRKELDRVLANSYHFTFQVEGVFAEEDVVRTVLGVFNLKPTPAADYIKASLHGASRKVTKEEPCTLEDLHWQRFVEKLPMFQDQTPRPGFRTGTVPYMSHEVLARNYSRLYVRPGDGKQWVHDAANDMESFLWVIIFLAITRGSPGGFRRDELDAGDFQNVDLRKVTNRFFDHLDKLEVEKQNLFTVSGDGGNGERILENDILKSFHPYFKPLKRLVRDWYKLLVMAFRWRASEYRFIHDHVLDLLTREIKALGSETTTLPIYNNKTNIELERRQQCRDFISNAFLDVHSLPNSQSPDRHKDRNQDTSPDMNTAKSKSRSCTHPDKEMRRGSATKTARGEVVRILELFCTSSNFTKWRSFLSAFSISVLSARLPEVEL
ncbi:hypothetical protein BU17DRAFT_66290 [Hysterangium stoloniferum]|nr:hypothetical protein BU17DRAFT_66290 [Hysterangium stoloniferum]